MKTMDELLIKYADTFGENFPLFMCMGMDDEEIMKIIKDCLKNGVPYEAEQAASRMLSFVKF